MGKARRRRIVVVGAGVAGSLVTLGLMDREDVELITLERVGLDDHSQAGTGLNVGPNAIKCLQAHFPALATTVIRESLPWRRWTVALTDGTGLMDLDLLAVADNPGIRIRWSELYRLLRSPIQHRVRFDTEVLGLGHQSNGRLFLRVRDHARGEDTALTDIDLLVGGDGRYSRLREFCLGPPNPRYLGVAIYRLLLDPVPDCPIDEYGQWFNGPARLLAFRVPGDHVYVAGAFPIRPDAPVPEVMKTPVALRAAYWPNRGEPSEQCQYLIDGICDHVERIHWARLQEDRMHYCDSHGQILLLGDAAHPMVPTLGQGATQAMEDGCVAAEELSLALDRGGDLRAAARAVAARREARVRFVVDFSREATDTMLRGGDPVAGTLAKCQPAFQDKLRRLYRDAPLPLALA